MISQGVIIPSEHLPVQSGFTKNKMNLTLIKPVELRPKSDPLRDIEITEDDLIGLDLHLLSNMM